MRVWVGAEGRGWQGAWGNLAVRDATVGYITVPGRAYSNGVRGLLPEFLTWQFWGGPENWHDWPFLLIPEQFWAQAPWLPMDTLTLHPRLSPGLRSITGWGG